MRNRRRLSPGVCRLAVYLLVFFILPIGTMASEKRPLTFQDVMKFKSIQNPKISENGKWVVYVSQPDRGNGEVVVQHTGNDTVFTIHRGHQPRITTDGKWVAALLKADVLLVPKKKVKPSGSEMVLLNTESGDRQSFKHVQKFSFSQNGRWLVVSFHSSASETGVKEKEESNKKDKKKKPGAPLLIKELTGEQLYRMERAGDFIMDPESRYLAVVSYEEKPDGVTLLAFDLAVSGLNRLTIQQGSAVTFGSLTWSKTGSLLAYLKSLDTGRMEGKATSDSLNQSADLYIWDGLKKREKWLAGAKNAPGGWLLPMKSRLTFSKDNKGIFFGLKPVSEVTFFQGVVVGKKKDAEIKDPFDFNDILKGRGVDVWHWNDPLIIPNQKITWNQRKAKSYTSWLNFRSGKIVQLTDTEVPDLVIPEKSDLALAYSRQPYQKEITWDGSYRDVYLVDMGDGQRKKILDHYGGRVSLSPGGKFLAYYLNKHWYLYRIKSGTTLNLTDKIEVPFYNEDHDYPSAVSGYGQLGWLDGDAGLLIYDKYDLWMFRTDNGSAMCVTTGAGRKKAITFRVQRLDPEQTAFSLKERLLLNGFSHEEKTTHFYNCLQDGSEPTVVTGGKKKFRFLAKVKGKDQLLYTCESFSEYPDLWTAGSDFKRARRISDVNPQIGEFFWGEPQLIEWTSLDGKRLQGVVIKPGDYEEGKRYPVVVYYYRIFSNRLHEFNQMVVNHRPNFPYYTSNGYIIFLPDVIFEVGRPGFAATKCVVPGVQKLIDMGLADPDGIGLHGHSWSGYQTAFIITQTDIFSAAVAGAPVSNMTSAYSGIRWASGMARQFQYEKTQSRIGGSLWEYPERYIENSPVFFADKINTPLLIQHGDVDGAVPWYQSIELYLALRRLDKDCIFLQYRGEPHHLQKYANKLDYSLKMVEYFDHYLKGKKAPAWISKGVPYRK